MHIFIPANCKASERDTAFNSSHYNIVRVLYNIIQELLDKIKMTL